MQIELIAIGKKMPSWVDEGFREYTKRLPKELKINLIEIPLAKSTSKTTAEQLKEKEAELILNAIPEKNYIIALDENGKDFSTAALSKQLEKILGIGKNVSIIIGGPEGLASEILQKADLILSLSRLTFPHPLVRIVIAEQIYRAWTLLIGHPYHRS